MVWLEDLAVNGTGRDTAVSSEETIRDDFPPTGARMGGFGPGTDIGISTDAE